MPMKPGITMFASHVFNAYPNCILENAMFHLLKPVPLTVVIAALSIITTGCATNSAQGRFFNALQNTNAYGGPNAAIDVEVNQVKVFSGLAFATPSSTYTNMASGNDTFEGFESSSSDTVPVFNNLTGNLTGGGQYTLIVAGLSGGSGPFAPTLIYQHDNNDVPPANMAEFRVINASPDSPPSVDVWIIPEPTGGPSGTCSSQSTNNCPISALAYTNISPYKTFQAVSGGFGLFVTLHGSTSLVARTVVPGTAGSITTVVLVDNQNGSSMSQTPVILEDLQ
jgi:uncharacterized protein DUF4397